MNARADSIRQDPLAELRRMFEQARQGGGSAPTAASLAMTDMRGQPSIQALHVLDIDERGPLFFVDRNGATWQRLEGNPCAALCFFWPEFDRQVVVEGHVEPAGSEIADRYWPVQAAYRTGPTGVHAAVRQSPRPAHWLAIRLRPDAIRFWRRGWSNPRGQERYVRDRRRGWRIDASGPT